MHMLNLLRKDFLVQKNLLFIMLPLLFVVTYFATSAIWEGILFSIAIIMQVFYADEKPSVHLLLNSLPFSRNQIVSSKYVGACVLIILVLATIFIGHFIFYKEVYPWNQMLLIACIVFLFISFAFPFSYLFHSQYLLIGSGVLFVLYLILINLFVPNMNDIIRGITQRVLEMADYQLYLLAIITVLVLYVSSWILSIRIYSKKVL